MVQQPYAGSDEEIASFVDACNALCESKYILCERKISDLMKVIASSPTLYGLFKKVLSGYNHKAEFAASVRRVGNRGKLVLPQSRPRLIAYIFCVLLAIDDGKPTIREFLDAYFYHTSPNEEFALFASALIVPFRDATEYICYNGIEPDEEDGSDAGLNESVRTILGEMNRRVSESTAPNDLKQDLYLIARAVSESLTPGRSSMIKPLVVGYRRAVRSTSLEETLTPLVDKLTRLFTIANLL